MNDLEQALNAYENALRHNPMSLSGLTQVAGIARIKENYPKVTISFLFAAHNVFPMMPSLLPPHIRGNSLFDLAPIHISDLPF